VPQRRKQPRPVPQHRELARATEPDLDPAGDRGPAHPLTADQTAGSWITIFIIPGLILLVVSNVAEALDAGTEVVRNMLAVAARPAATFRR
jgi:hypothetical protein